MTWETYTRDFERTFPRGSKIRPDRGSNRGSSGIAVDIPCTAGHTVTEIYEKRLPSDKLRSHLSKKNWLFKGNRATCPKHREKDVTEKPASSDTARRAKREAMAWLDESFDVEKGRYKEGISDTTIAKETSLSEHAVATLREDFFGALKEPAEFAEWRRKIAELQERAEAMQTEAGKVCAALLAELRQLSEKIDKAIQRNGW